LKLNKIHHQLIHKYKLTKLYNSFIRVIYVNTESIVGNNVKIIDRSCAGKNKSFSPDTTSI